MLTPRYSLNSEGFIPKGLPSYNYIFISTVFLLQKKNNSASSYYHMEMRRSTGLERKKKKCHSHLQNSTKLQDVSPKWCLAPICSLMALGMGLWSRGFASFSGSKTASHSPNYLDGMTLRISLPTPDCLPQLPIRQPTFSPLGLAGELRSVCWAGVGLASKVW